MRLGELRTVGIAALALQNADQVDDCVRLRDEGGKLDGIEEIGFDYIHRQQRQLRRILATPRRDAHVLAKLDKRIHQMTADKPRSADQRNGLMSHLRLHKWRSAKASRRQRRA